MLLLRRSFKVILFLLSSLALFDSPVYAELPKVVLQALVDASSEAVQKGTRQLTPGQQALLVQYNDAINSARTNGWINAQMYQAGQEVFASVSADKAGRAGRSVNAGFTVQQSTRKTYMPGTDSDYIYQLDPNRPDPVGDVGRMQKSYNRGINDFIEQSLANDPEIRAAMEAENVRFTRRTDWHRRLDVDFMADPKTVSQAQFEEIARLNNDAYTRREAAEYERISRARDGTRVTPEMYTKYVEAIDDRNEPWSR